MSNSSPTQKADKPLPQCKAILLCERVIREAGTGQHSVIGIVRRLNVRRLPAQSRPLTLYLQLAEGIGAYNIGAAVWDLASGQALAQGQGALFEFRDRLTSLEIVLPLPPLPLMHEGNFDVVVYANGQEIDRQKFAVALLPAGGGA